MIEFGTIWIIVTAFMVTHILIHEPIHDGIKLICKSQFPKMHDSLIGRIVMGLVSGILVITWATLMVVFAFWTIGLLL